MRELILALLYNKFIWAQMSKCIHKCSSMCAGAGGWRVLPLMAVEETGNARCASAWPLGSWGAGVYTEGTSTAVTRSVHHERSGQSWRLCFNFPMTFSLCSKLKISIEIRIWKHIETLCWTIHSINRRFMIFFFGLGPVTTQLSCMSLSKEYSCF